MSLRDECNSARAFALWVGLGAVVLSIIFAVCAGIFKALGVMQ